MDNNILLLDHSHGTLFTHFEKGDPDSKLHGLKNGSILYLDNENSTYYGYTEKGVVLLTLVRNGFCFPVPAGYFFAVNEPITVQQGCGIVIEHTNQVHGMQLGGPVAAFPRLKHTDGMHTSLLASPVSNGAPSLNCIYVPHGTSQTPCSHKTIRYGFVSKGYGLLATAVEGTIQAEGSYEIKTGQIFVIPPDLEYGFITGENDTLEIIMYQPYSDWGPEHQDNPVINDTLVDGVGASGMNEIATK